MGYEIAGGLGVKMARPDREVIVMVGDGSYLMLNNEIATSVMLDKKLSLSCWIIAATAASIASSNIAEQTLSTTCWRIASSGDGAPNIDFAANAASWVRSPRRWPIFPSSKLLSSGRGQPSAPI